MDEQVTRGVGRPRREFDTKLFENLCYIQCTREEIAFAFGCDPDTLNRWCNATYGANFTAVKEWYGSDGRMSLRRHLFEQSKKGQTGATIFALKAYCGITEKIGIQPIAPEGPQTRVIDDLEAVYATIEECKAALPSPSTP